MGWRTIQIEEADSIKLYLDNLLIYRENKKITIELNSIDTIIIDNNRINISVQILNKIAENNILLIFCNNKHVPQSQLIPMSGNFNTLKIIQKQIKWSTNNKGNCWMKIVKNKILNQELLLKHLGLKHDQLSSLIDEVDFYDINNREGHASKIYWHKMFGLDFKRTDENSINLYLNYGYAILRSMVCRSIIKKGLDPRISVFHKSYDNFFALASDLMEPFRPIVDYKVYQIINSENRVLYAEAKEILNLFISNAKILCNGKYEFLNNSIDIYIDKIIASFEPIQILLPYDKF